MKKLLALVVIGCMCILFAACERQGQEVRSDQIVPASSDAIQPPETKPLEDLEQSTEIETIDLTGLPDTGYDWYFQRNSEHLTPYVNQDTLGLLDSYHAIYTLSNQENKVYLTFDCGYELGYTGQILDVLQEHNIKAAFFITGYYIESQPELVQRMYQEGHLVCNHTWGHPDLSTISSEELAGELERLDQAFQELTGAALQPYLRPPMGRYSERSLAATMQQGYNTVFWSMAWKDWDPNQQPGADYVYQHVIDNIHPGAVILLHVVSQSDTEALERIINGLQEQGYSCAVFCRHGT